MNLLKKTLKFSTTWTGTIIIVLLFIFFIAQAFVIPSRSMVGTFYEGDMLFVKKFSYGLPIPRIPWLEIPILPDFNGNGQLISGSRPKRGDVVIFMPPHVEKTYYVKRVFAVGGDKIIFTHDGLFLRPHEGDDYIERHYLSEDLRQFDGEWYVKDPHAREFAGVWYESIYHDPDGLTYLRDERGYYQKYCVESRGREINIADSLGGYNEICSRWDRRYVDDSSLSALTREDNAAFFYMGQSMGCKSGCMRQVVVEDSGVLASLDARIDGMDNGFGHDLESNGDFGREQRPTERGRVGAGQKVAYFVEVPEDEYFFVGDNRNNSLDSRFWGSVPYRSIVGKPWFIYFSMSLANSLEFGAERRFHKRYIVRWERMFKGTDGIEELARERRGNRYD